MASAAGVLAEFFTAVVQRHPVFLRAALRLLAGRAPVVARGRQVRAVFDRPEDFLMGYLNEPKLKPGPFLLGMDPSDQYDTEKVQLADCIETVADRYPGIVAIESKRALGPLAEEARRAGRIELASRYAERVLAGSLAGVFGVPLEGVRSAYLAGEEGSETLGLMIRTMGVAIASPFPGPFGWQELAVRVAPEFDSVLERAAKMHLSGQVAGLDPEHLEVLPADATIIGQLASSKPFGQGDGSAWIKRNVRGMMSAAAGFSKAFTHSLHELLRRPDAMKELVAASETGDTDRVQAYVREAMRFRPVFPLLVRYCPRATALGALPAERHRRDDTAPRECPAGKNVSISPLAAMFDRELVDRPEEFIPGRPDETYLLFGRAPRRCIGEPLIMGMFAPMLATLLAELPAIADAAPGRFRYDGAAMERYEVQLPAAREAGR